MREACWNGNEASMMSLVSSGNSFPLLSQGISEIKNIQHEHGDKQWYCTHI